MTSLTLAQYQHWTTCTYIVFYSMYKHDDVLLPRMIDMHLHAVMFVTYATPCTCMY